MADTDTSIAQAAINRKIAEQCRTLAGGCTSDYGRDALLKLANTWDRIAEVYDRLSGTGKPLAVLLLVASLLAALLGTADCVLMLIMDE